MKPLSDFLVETAASIFIALIMWYLEDQNQKEEKKILCFGQ